MESFEDQIFETEDADLREDLDADEAGADLAAALEMVSNPKIWGRFGGIGNESI